MGSKLKTTLLAAGTLLLLTKVGPYIAKKVAEWEKNSRPVSTKTFNGRYDGFHNYNELGAKKIIKIDGVFYDYTGTYTEARDAQTNQTHRFTQATYEDGNTSITAID